MKIKDFTLLCFFSIAFSQISVNELQKFSNSDLDKIRQQLEVETKENQSCPRVDRFRINHIFDPKNLQK